jgi:type IV pilus assembly protein PilY1
MMRAWKAIVLAGAMAVAGLSLVGDDGRAQSVTNGTYSAVPPFVSANSIPNVLLLIDNSGSMSNRGCESTSCGKRADGTTSTSTAFCLVTDATCPGAQPTTYSGYFNSMQCYDYDATNTRFEAKSTKASLAEQCPSSRWDGNFLNWATFRRFDAVKKAMIGGDCVTARAADGTCPETGSPPLKTVKAQTSGVNNERAPTSTTNPGGGLQAVNGNNGWKGRVPQSVAEGGLGVDPADLWMQTTSEGKLCVDQDPSFDAPCGGDGGYVETYLELRIGTSTEPTGVVQQVGSQARFGLAVFNSDNQGSRVLVGIGARQAIDFNATTIETFNTNTAAMIDGIQESFPATWTPLAESLYDAVRYVAQINSASHPGSYNHPIAFSGGNSNGVNFQTAGVGGIGGAEISALTGSETCPAGYITDACGRDPYFFGSNHSPMWASPSSEVSCCPTFIIVFTDGEPTQDDGTVPAALQDYAHAHHGVHCTGSNGTIHAPDGTCNTNAATPTATLLGEHKTDYGSSGRHYLDDVAYWGHTVDLRQATIPVISEAGHPITGTQNVTVYTFFAFGNISGREILMQTAKQGGFDDANADGIPQSGEYDKVNNETGASGGDGIPDTYFESSNVDDLQQKLTAALSSILQRSTSGTSLSVLATSTTGEGALYQSFFFPKVTEGLTNVYWIGYTQALFLDTFGNLREDSDGDGRLVYKYDKIIKTRFDTTTNEVRADLFSDTTPSPNGDGKADSTTASSTVALKDIKPIWEAGRQLADRDIAVTPRKIITWIDSNGDKVVDSSEVIDFENGNRAKLQPYLRASTTTESGNIIDWIRGSTVSGYRNRELTVGGSTKTWRYGDTIHSTPTVVGQPRERYDILYGDEAYSDYFIAYKDRRQVAYVGANDGMLHAFNVGFYHSGDDSSTSTQEEHGWFTDTPTGTSHSDLGKELWAFVPQELLPQLKFLTQGDYQHVYYVDQKPKISDVRIFCDSGGNTPSPCVTGQGSASHPGGWGTVLIGAFRLGGSCRACNVGATELSVTADFTDPPDSVNETRKFRSVYFALDITDPERDPKLLWVLDDDDLGLGLSYPTLARVKRAGGNKADPTNAKWFMITGSGPTGYDVGSVQTARVFAVDMIAKATSNVLNTGYYKFPTPLACGSASPNSECALIGNIVSVDFDLDYRVDIMYFGNMICNASTAPCNGTATPTWKGKLYRLTTGSSANPEFGTEIDPCEWGIGGASCGRSPTVLLADFACSGSCTGANKVGPVSAAPNLAMDDSGKLWVYWGTGRYFANADKTNADQQHFFGVKDLVPTAGCTQTTATDCEEKDLLNVSNAEVCVLGTATGSGTCTATTQVSGVTGVDSFDSSSGSSNTLVGAIQSKDGWYTTLPDARERALSMPTIIAGLVFFPTFVPQNDICSASGTSFLYALYYKSGTAYKESVIGTTTSGSNTNVAKRAQIGDPGLASGVAVHVGSQGSGANGSGGGGCQGRLTANIQSSTGSVEQICLKTAGVPWSYYVSWLNQRE